jgi:hypothetical protein
LQENLPDLFCQYLTVMTFAMNFTGRPFALLIATLCSTAGLLAVSGCQSTAESYCTHGDREHPDEGGFSGPALEGCVYGYLTVGPAHSALQEAEGECDEHFDVRSALFDPLQSEDETTRWAEKTNHLIDLRNGCHFGARGYQRMRQDPMDAGLPGGVPEPDSDAGTDAP